MFQHEITTENAPLSIGQDDRAGVKVDNKSTKLCERVERFYADALLLLAADAQS